MSEINKVTAKDCPSSVTYECNDVSEAWALGYEDGRRSSIEAISELEAKLEKYEARAECAATMLAAGVHSD